MENSSDEVYVRVEHPSIGRKMIAVASIVSAIFFVICVAVGATGPSIFSSKDVGEQTFPIEEDGTVTYEAHLVDMMTTHRMIIMSARIQRPDFFEATVSSALSYTQDALIKVETTDEKGTQKLLFKPYSKKIPVSCQMNQQWCNSILLFYEPFIHYKTYDVEVVFIRPNTVNGIIYGNDLVIDISITFQDAKYTRFELIWGYVFLAITIFMMFCPVVGFFWGLRKMPQGKLTKQQQWVTALLCTLFLYDDPLFAAEVGLNHAGLSALYAIFMATFTSTILLYWLCIVEDIRTAAEIPPRMTKGQISRYFWPKFTLCLAIWLTLVGAYFCAKKTQMVDPAFDAHNSGQNEEFYIATAVFMAIYVIWIMYLIIMCFRHVKQMILGYKFLFGLTLCVIIITIVDVLLVAFYPLRGSPVGLLSIFGIYNIYVWFLAIAYTPYDTARTYDTQKDATEEIEIVNVGKEVEVVDVAKMETQL